MEEVLECGECGEVFSSEETLKKHANFKHGRKNVQILDGRSKGSILTRIREKVFG